MPIKLVIKLTYSAFILKNLYLRKRNYSPCIFNKKNPKIKPNNIKTKLIILVKKISLAIKIILQ